MARTAYSRIIRAMEDGTFFVDRETPSGFVNGVNTTYTLADTPNPASSLEVLANGQIQSLTTDYSLSGNTLTTVIAYPTGTILRVNYRVEPI